MQIKSINSKLFKNTIVKKGLAQWKVAHDLGLSPSMLSHYVAGRHVCPTGMRKKIEAHLGLPDGSLKLSSEYESAEF